MSFFSKLAMAAVILAGVLYIALSGFIKYNHLQELKKAQSKYVGKLAPEDEILKSYLGKRVILIFFSTKQKESIKEIEVITKLYDEMEEKGFKDDILSVVLDENLTQNELDEFIKAHKIKYKVIFDEDHVALNNPFIKKFDILGIPSIWVIDENGKVLAQNLKSIFHTEEFLKR